MVKTYKIIYTRSKEQNGVIHRNARLSLQKTKLEEMGISERNPYVEVTYEPDQIIIRKI